MPAQQRIKLVFYAIQWVLFAEFDPLFMGDIVVQVHETDSSSMGCG
jgi:hypothetical protein